MTICSKNVLSVRFRTVGLQTPLSALFNQAPGGVRQEQPPLVNRFLSLPGCVIVTLANDGTEAAAGENLLQ